jgi:uncharacterized protein YbjT (DUF2867 family)
VVAPALTAAGYEVRAGSRSGPVRTAFDEPGSLQQAVSGVDTVLHLASNTSPLTRQGDDWMARQLLAARDAAAPQAHLVLLSIVGCDRTPFAYYRAKARAEALVRAAPRTRIVRATQFHGFVRGLVPTVPVLGRTVAPRGWRLQPVAESFVADVLVAAVRDPGGAPAEVAGPEVLTLAEIARRVRGDVRELPLPGRLARAVRAGSLLPGPDAVCGGPAFS